MSDLIFIAASKSAIMSMLRTFFTWLDSVVYELFASVMQLIFDITKISGDELFRSAYEDIFVRIYAILAIFMLFKLTISLLNYLINPDSIVDKERGLGKMIGRVMVSLVMLIAFRNVFTFMYDVQPHILEALPRIVFGTEVKDSNLASSVYDQGYGIALNVYNGVWVTCADGVSEDQCRYYERFSSIVDHINDEHPSKSGEYMYNYTLVIGTVVGIVMTFLMVAICIDIAIRVFKLMILEIIAPIPILSYIDPKSSKDGAFSKWIKMVISVYAEIFLKLGIVYFVVLLINKLIASGAIFGLIVNNFSNNGALRGSLVLVALVLGLLFFARSAPKFIMDSLGIKGSGSITGIGLGGALAAGGALLGGAGIAGALAAGSTAMNENADALAQGKAPSAGWGKGSDFAAQLRSGDKNAKGGISNRMQAGLSRAAGERRAKALGLDDDHIKLGKDQMISAQNNANLAAQAYSAAAAGQFTRGAGGVILDAFGRSLGTTDEAVARQMLSEQAMELSAYSQKVSSDYQSASAARDAIVGKDSPAKKYQASKRQFNKDQAGRERRQSVIDTYNTRQRILGHDERQIDRNLENKKAGDYRDNRQPYDPLR